MRVSQIADVTGVGVFPADCWAGLRGLSGGSLSGDIV
jgi:hypothetical protein